MARALAAGMLAFAAILPLAAPALAYGPQGHLIAGRAAELFLCPRAAATVDRLGDGDDLGELGLWADQVRSDATYADTAPWHYMNIDDDAAISDYVHPPEGDVLWAVENFAQRLGDEGLADSTRAEALRFLVHFVVDLHQPLHVGRAEDRGGNSVRLQFRGEETNLHRFWDTHVIEWLDRSVSEYVTAISGGDGLDAFGSLDPGVWAAESLVLRDRVYAFGREGEQPSRAYHRFAAETTEARLRLSALRLAGTLNALFCSP